MVCKPCEHATEFGWWGDTLPADTATHCRVCHQDIPGANVWGHCTGCHITFRGDTAFLRHQMVTECPDTVDNIAGALSSIRAAQKLKGKRYLDSFTHDWGFTYWAWDKADKADRVSHNA